MNTAHENSLQRFLDAQEADYPRALSEIKAGKKTTHWMWYVFPQLRGLGSSTTAKFYGIQDFEEAKEYYGNPILCGRLIEISEALLALKSSDAHAILGSPDDMKLQSCMTLFAAVPGASPVFNAVLGKFYNGEQDQRTLSLLDAS